MKKNILLLAMIAVTATLSAMSWHYFGSDGAGILRGKPGAVMSWLPTILRVHIAGGMLAMTTGAALVFTSGRNMRPTAHRWIGRVYGLSVLVSGLAAAVIAPHAIGGWISGLGLLSLGTFWVYFTGRTVLFAVRGDFVRHRRSAVFSLALTYSSLTFRLGLLGAFLGFPFVHVYRTSCWVSWLLHLGIAAWYLHRQTITQPSKLQLS